MWYSDTGLRVTRPRTSPTSQTAKGICLTALGCNNSPNKRTAMPKIKGAKRTLEVKIRLTETEWNELQQRKTKSLAGWLRDLGLGAVPIRQADPDLIRHLARIGSNLNQIQARQYRKTARRPSIAGIG